MGITYRRYKDLRDYERICEFLEGTYSSYGTRFDDNINLFEFQCALSRGREGTLKELDDILNKAFLWFDGEELVGILEGGSFCIAPDYRHIFHEIVQVGEKICSEEDDDIEWNIFDGDEDFENVLNEKGYYRTEEYWVNRDIDRSAIEDTPKLPDGFYVKLVPDLENHDRVYQAYKLCYGILFNEVIFENFYKTSTYRKELDMVIMGPDDKVVALCSGRYDEKNKMASIEAVSCYHEYRRKGISKAMILHALHEAKNLGAEKVTVFTAMPERYPAPNRLYESVGFNVVGNSYVWKKNKQD